MKKVILTDKTPALAFKINAFITHEVFVVLLADYFYNRSQDFPKQLRRKQAIEILLRQFCRFGRQGEHQDGFFEAANGMHEKYMCVYNLASAWAQKNYPYLTPKNK